MKILAVDTCLGACSVALLDGGEILAHRFEAMERGHAEALAPMVEEVMRGHDFAALDLLAVTVGPGTFTGQRVGLSFMRGLKLALKKPLIDFTSLAAMGAQAIAATKAPHAAVIHDARRGEVYFELVTAGGDALHSASLLSFEKALEIVRDCPVHTALAGTAAAQIAERLQPEGRPVVLTDIVAPDASWVGYLVGSLYADEIPDADAPPPAPLYLRAPDAKLPGGRELVSPFEGDAAALAALHAASFAQPWDAAALRDLLAGPGVFAFAAASGFVLARAAGGEAEILTLAVLPSARGRGLGRALMQAAASHAVTLGADSLFLEVGTDNPAALALYARLGLQRVGARKGYYASHSQTAGDALVLKAALPLAGNLP